MPPGAVPLQSSAAAPRSAHPSAPSPAPRTSHSHKPAQQKPQTKGHSKPYTYRPTQTSSDSDEGEEEDEDEDEGEDDEDQGDAADTELNVDAELDEGDDDDVEDDDEENEEIEDDDDSAERDEDDEMSSDDEPAPQARPAKASSKSPAAAASAALTAPVNAAEKPSKKRKAEHHSDADDSTDEHLRPAAKKLHGVNGAVPSSSPHSAPAVRSAASAASIQQREDFTPDDLRFTSLPLSPATQKAIAAMGFTKMTPVQARCIPVGLKGDDILGSARTGSGKTLAFLIPAVELLVRSGFKPRNGTGVLIISPTRELALQIYGVAKELCQFHTFTYHLVMGGANVRPETDRLTSGVNLLIGTPGRVLDHLEHHAGWNYKNLVQLVIDEADRILEMGFEDQLKAIIRRLPKTPRQTLLFSATQTKNVKDIAVLAMPGAPVYIGVDDGRPESTVEGVEQGYVVCPSESRFLLLFTFLKKNQNKKVIVFFSTCAATSFYTELLNYIDVPVQELHGKQKQAKRTATFFEFVNAKKGILCCTDVAARGLDIPQVDWIIQFDPPEEPKEYIHRVGRTARGEGKKGRALLFLLPQEIGFLRYLRDARVPLNEYEFPQGKISRVQEQLEHLVSENYYLHKSAREAYRSYMQGYAQHTLKKCFDVEALDLYAVAKSFGFTAPPQVPLKISLKSLGKAERRATLHSQLQGGLGKHGFSEENPYGHPAQNGPQRNYDEQDRRNEQLARKAQEAVRNKQHHQQQRQWSR